MPMARARRCLPAGGRSCRPASSATRRRAARSWRSSSRSRRSSSSCRSTRRSSTSAARAGCSEPASEIAALLRARVRAETGLTVSVGVATTKFLAKLASDLAKPDGLLAVAPGTERDVPRAAPRHRLVGSRPGDAADARAHGCAHDRRRRARSTKRSLVRALGTVARRASHALARNDDERDGRARPRREVDRCGGDLRRPTCTPTRRAERELVRLADRVAARVCASGARGAHGHVEDPFRRLRDAHRARTLPVATDVSTRRSLDDRTRAARRTSTSPAGCGCSACRCRSSSARPRSRARSSLDDDAHRDARARPSAAPRSSTRSTPCATDSATARSAPGDVRRRTRPERRR